jgi:polyisoprenoid-binding protein YceI
MKFKSTKTESPGSNRLKVTGDLTIHGITRPTALEMEFYGPVKSPFGGEITMGFSGSMRINRQDFGIAWNEKMEDGSPMISNDADISIDIEADRT